MRCPICNAVVINGTTHCNFCGQNLEVVSYIRRISGTYYNIGLEKAKVRDLTGAISSLRKSLQYDKTNTTARNLLGLVYYEIGEIVAALSEWVLSKYFQPEDNAADYYIDTLQKNPVSLDATDQTIKKYNAALASAQAGNVDLAIIQLKKVVSLNPHFLRAAHLLSLLYMKEGDYAKADKILQRIRRIDNTNTTTLRYLQETAGKVSGEGMERPKKVKKDPLENVQPVGTYREEKRSLMPFIYVVIGLVVGIAVCFVLIRPTLQRAGSGGDGDIASVSDQLSVKESRIVALEAERDDLQEKVGELEKQIKNADSQAQIKAEKYEKLIKGALLYIDGDHIGAAAAVKDCSKKDFSLKEAKELYTKIATLPDEEIRQLIETARRTIETSYDEAIRQLKALNSVVKNNQTILYLLGRCYHYKGDKKNAKKYYEKAISVQAGTEEAIKADRYLMELSGRQTPEPEATATPKPNRNDTADDEPQGGEDDTGDNNDNEGGGGADDTEGGNDREG